MNTPPLILRQIVLKNVRVQRQCKKIECCGQALNAKTPENVFCLQCCMFG